MIIKALLDLLYGVFALLTAPINIPGLPDQAFQAVSNVTKYMLTGFAIVGAYVDINYLWTLFKLILAVDIGIGLYKFVMFIIRKIPFFGIS